LKLVLLTVVIVQLTVTPAFAYIDPNTGGYVFQFLFPIFAAIAAGYVFFKNQIKRIALKLFSFFKKPDNGQ